MKAECATFWAGWGVIATSAVGVVTIVVAVLAWWASRRATQIAAQATLIAKQQQDDAERYRAATAKLVGRLVLFEVSGLPGRLMAATADFEKAMGGDATNPFLSTIYIQAALGKLRLPALPGADLVEDRLHTLPGELGFDLAGVMGASRSLGAMAERISSQIKPPGNGVTEGLPFAYSGDTRHFDALRTVMKEVLDLSTKLANDFQGFMGEKRTDYQSLATGEPPLAA